MNNYILLTTVFPFASFTGSLWCYRSMASPTIRFLPVVSGALK